MNIPNGPIEYITMATNPRHLDFQLAEMMQPTQQERDQFARATETRALWEALQAKRARRERVAHVGIYALIGSMIALIIARGMGYV